MLFSHTVRGERFAFPDLRALLARANEPNSVDALAGLTATSERERIDGFQLFNTQSRVASKGVYLRRPDLGRMLSDHSRELLSARCPTGRDLQVVIGDGLSAAAVAKQSPGLLDRLRIAGGRSGGRSSCGTVASA